MDLKSLPIVSHPQGRTLMAQPTNALSANKLRNRWRFFIRVMSTAGGRLAAIERDWNQTNEGQVVRAIVDKLVHLVGIDHEDVAGLARMKLAVELDPRLAAGNDHFVFVVVLVARSMPARGDGVVAHRKVGGAVLATDHQAHRHPLGVRNVQRNRWCLLDPSLEHEAKVSRYVVTVAKLRIQGFPLGDWQTNAWLVWVEGWSGSPPNPAWIIDPGDQPDRLLNAIKSTGATPVAILFTHAHLDHIMGLERVLAVTGDLPIYAHPCEWSWFGDPMLNLSAMAGVDPVSVRAPTLELNDGDELKLGPTSWRVMHTPGHSPGSVSFVCDEARVVISGDTLFAGSIGRSDFPTSSSAALMNSLRNKLMTLGDDYAVYPGHGDSTTIGRERKFNPFLT